jgi:thiol-disulfide isomerase/thioredoxin
MLVMLLLFLKEMTMAQTFTPIPNTSILQLKSSVGLNIGDNVPNVEVGAIINYSNKKIRLSDFKGKLLILDFWNTYCGSCIQAIPRLDSLRRKFGSSIMILPVTYETKERILAFQKSNTYLKGLRFPTVTNDKVLSKLFPHSMVPHDVWINAKGKVVAITEVRDITDSTIKSQLKGNAITTKKKDVLDYDPEMPLLVNNNGGNDNEFLYRSLLTGYLKGLPASIAVGQDTVRGITWIRATNVSAKDLYALTFKELRNLPSSQVVNDAKARLMYYSYNKKVIYNDQLYCYDLRLPSLSVRLTRETIHEDLDRFFMVNSRWLWKDTSALVMIPIGEMLPEEDLIQPNSIILTIGKDSSAISSSTNLGKRLSHEGQILVVDSAKLRFSTPLYLKETALTLLRLNLELKHNGICLVRRRVKLLLFKIQPLPEAYDKREGFYLY